MACIPKRYVCNRLHAPTLTRPSPHGRAQFDLRDTVECTDDCPQTLIKPSIQSLLAGNVHEFDIDWKSHVRFSSAASRSDVRIRLAENVGVHGMRNVVMCGRKGGGG